MLGSLMQPTDRPYVDRLKEHNFTSCMTINMLTMNHGNLTRNPKLCRNEADAFLHPGDERSKELIKTFIRFRHKGIVTQQRSSRPVARFVRGGPSARVELLARHISTKRQDWGTRLVCSDVSLELNKISLMPSTVIPLTTVWPPQDYLMILRSTLERDCRHEPLFKHTDATEKPLSSRLSRTMNSVDCFRNHPMTELRLRQPPCHEGRSSVCDDWSFPYPSVNHTWSSKGRFSISHPATTSKVPM